MKSSTAPLIQFPKINRVFLYTTIISVLGILMLAYALINFPEDRDGILIFALLVAIAELGSVSLFQTSRNSRVSVSMIVSLAAIVALDPMAGVLIQLVSGVASTFAQNVLYRSESNNGASWLRRALFNTGMLALSAGAAGEVYLLSGGSTGSVLELSNLLPIFLAALTDSLVNIGILLGVISLQTGCSPWSIWKENFQWAVWITVPAGVLGGGALAWAYLNNGLLGVSVFFLPILTIGYSFRVYANNMREYVNKLETLNEELHENNLNLLETLGAVIDAYDVYTYGHSTQVAIYVDALVQKLKLPEDEQELIVKAALVHDIGKIGISDTIIGKNGVLTRDEVDIMHRHPTIGAEILGRMKGMKDVTLIVRSHHERFDGSGYPDRLKGEEIPLGARVMALADSLDAMCSDRAYRQALPFSHVVAEIVECSGKQFDPRVVQAFLELMTEKGPEFFRNSAQEVDRDVLLCNVGITNQGARRFLKRSLIK